jgi:hypothetical protein
MRFMKNQRLFRIKVGSPDDPRHSSAWCAVSNSLTIAEPMKPVAHHKDTTLIFRRRPSPVEEIGCTV